MSQFKSFLELASHILGVDICAAKPEIQYAYYRMMKLYHPDKNCSDLRANRLAALINEAKEVIMGRETNPTLLKDQELIAELMNQPVSDEEVLSYDEWLKKNFYNMEQCSIWPC